MCVKNTHKIENISDGGGGIHNVLRNFLLYVFIILINNDPHPIYFNSAENVKNMVPKHDV